MGGNSFLCLYFSVLEKADGVESKVRSSEGGGGGGRSGLIELDIMRVSAESFWPEKKYCERLPASNLTPYSVSKIQYTEFRKKKKRKERKKKDIVRFPVDS